MAQFDQTLLAASGNTLAFATSGALARMGLITGTIKLAQRWLLEFLTPIGSMKLRPTRGSTFMSRLADATLDNELDVFAAFAAALPGIADNLRSEQLDTDPAEEQYVGAELRSVTATPDRRLLLRVSIASAAGSRINTLAQLQLG